MWQLMFEVSHYLRIMVRQWPTSILFSNCTWGHLIPLRTVLTWRVEILRQLLLSRDSKKMAASTHVSGRTENWRDEEELQQIRTVETKHGSKRREGWKASPRCWHKDLVDKETLPLSTEIKAGCGGHVLSSRNITDARPCANMTRPIQFTSTRRSHQIFASRLSSLSTHTSEV